MSEERRGFLWIMGNPQIKYEARKRFNVQYL
jgi:hypothetical protein